MSRGFIEFVGRTILTLTFVFVACSFVTMAYVYANQSYVPSSILDPLDPMGVMLGLSVRTFMSQYPGSVLTVPLFVFAALGLGLLGQTLINYGNFGNAPLTFAPILFGQVPAFRNVTFSNGDSTSVNVWIWMFVLFSLILTSMVVLVHCGGLLVFCWYGKWLRLAGLTDKPNETDPPVSTLAKAIYEIPAEKESSNELEVELDGLIGKRRRERKKEYIREKRDRRVKKMKEMAQPRTEALWVSMFFTGGLLRSSQALAAMSIIKCGSAVLGCLVFFIKAAFLSMYLVQNPRGMVFPPYMSGMFPTAVQFGLTVMETIPSYAPTLNFFGAPGAFFAEFFFVVAGVVAANVQLTMTESADVYSGRASTPYIPWCYLSTSCYTQISTQGIVSSAYAGGTIYVLQPVGAFAVNTYFARILDALILTFAWLNGLAAFAQICILAWSKKHGVELNWDVKEYLYSSPLLMFSELLFCQCVCGAVPDEDDDEEEAAGPGYPASTS